MNDPKAAAAYYPGGAPVVRPDLDALIAKLHHHADLSTGGKQRSSLFREAANTLAQMEILEFNLDEARTACTMAENERDQALQRIGAAPHAAHCSLVYSVWKSSATRCTCWKSAAPTAEQ